MNLTTAVENFILDRRARALRPATIITYRRQLHSFLTFAGDAGATDLADVDVTFLRRFIVAGLQRGLSPASVRTAVQCVRVFLNWAVVEELMDASPMARVKMPKLDAPNPDAFTVQEVQALLTAAPSTRDRALVLFLLDTGARLGETAALTVGDVDIDTGRVTLRTQTKSRRPRSVFLGQRARAALATYLAEMGKPAGPLWWQSFDGKAILTANGLQEAIKRLGRRAGVHPCGPHKFRRTHARWSLRAGMERDDLRRLLGHSNDSLLKYYASLDDDDLQAAHALHGPVDHWLTER